jgi:hypothetical protein
MASARFPGQGSSRSSGKSVSIDKASRSLQNIAADRAPCLHPREKIFSPCACSTGTISLVHLGGHRPAAKSASTISKIASTVARTSAGLGILISFANPGALRSYLLIAAVVRHAPGGCGSRPEWKAAVFEMRQPVRAAFGLYKNQEELRKSKTSNISGIIAIREPIAITK